MLSRKCNLHFRYPVQTPDLPLNIRGLSAVKENPGRLGSSSSDEIFIFTAAARSWTFFYGTQKIENGISTLKMFQNQVRKSAAIYFVLCCPSQIALSPCSCQSCLLIQGN